jgi:radical SAM enzyme (rSAM/lipoprotein system)
MKKEFRPSFRQRLALDVFAKYRNVQAKLHDLSYLFWECTVRCNIKCLHCGSDCSPDDGSSDMPAEDFLKVTAQIRDFYNPNKVMIVLTGGEPLMRNDLAMVGKRLYQQGYPWGMVTNGYAMTAERFHDLLSSGLRSITISLDGLEEEHNWLRGRNTSFRRAVEAISLAAATPDIAFDVVTCVNARNFLQLNKIKDLLLSLGVQHWRLFTITPIGRAKENKELFIDQSQFAQLLEFIKTCREKRKIIASYGCEGFLGDDEGKVRAGYFFCRAGINIASVLNDGSISACPNNSRNVVQGNIYTDDFMDVWQNRFQVMRDRQWTKTGKCADCKAFKWCNGNGLHLRDFEHDDVMVCHLEMLINGKNDSC